MDLDERMGWFIIGALVGIVLGYIVRLLQDIKAEVHDVDVEVKHQNGGNGNGHHKDESGIVSRRVTLNISLGIVVALTAYAAIASQFALNNSHEQQQKNLAALCKSGANTRHVQRALVDAIYNLATTSLQRDTNAPPLSEARLKMYNDYIDKVNLFRSSMYQQIVPPPRCAPYVHDFNVKPPTPPFPHITQ